MVKSVLALALLAISGSALAYQQQPAPLEGAAEAAPAEAEEATAEDQVATRAPADTAEAEEAPEAEVSLKDDYRSAARAYSKCRLNARRDGGPAAVTAACKSHRKRMLAIKEEMRDAK